MLRRGAAKHNSQEISIVDGIEIDRCRYELEKI